ncbi:MULTISPECIES: ribosome silencing factor [Marinomonas]|uniref:Ribosomal silencing factor RsfS n=2 Tax=Marinomonas TaxID=28253 RepID=A0A366CZ38_9GAMM|nr:MULTISPECIES: ribosome silencing factor [Marinomonas]AEF54267.1 iojap-like protein [Marinomonas posidonica IVIA-Po-181]KZN14809.1 ribosomal silencing factor RsfS [Marinomonas sp. TW1]RBO82258.1 ribosome-associated protein [Marinomonas aquiplantarum]
MSQINLTADQILAFAVEALEDVKGDKITVLNVADHTDMMDYMVICTGTSKRHVHSLGQNVFEFLKQKGLQPLGTEGRDMGSDWVLVDLHDVVVHVMTEEARTFYDLEKLWDIKPEER